MTKFQNRVGTKCFSPKGTKVNSPGQGQVSAAKQADALGWMHKRMFGRASSFAINRCSAEADTSPRLDFVLGYTPSNCDVYRSDDDASAFLTQGCAQGCHILPIQGNFVALVGFI